jgi:hypothetical protein
VAALVAVASTAAALAEEVTWAVSAELT